MHSVCTLLSHYPTCYFEINLSVVENTVWKMKKFCSITPDIFDNKVCRIVEEDNFVDCTFPPSSGGLWHCKKVHSIYWIEKACYQWSLLPLSSRIPNNQLWFLGFNDQFVEGVHSWALIECKNWNHEVRCDLNKMSANWVQWSILFEECKIEYIFECIFECNHYLIWVQS